MSNPKNIDAIVEYVRSEAWKEIKGMLLQKMNLVNSISTLDVTQSRESLLREVETRASAIELVQQWLDDVEGMVDNRESALHNDSVEGDIYNVR